jgi:uncharacterized protein YndB with AHSA1/START domain
MQITRQIDLDIPADELWRLIATTDGWAEWMVDAAEFTPGASTGWVIDQGVRRMVTISEVVDGSTVRFTWSDGADESQVELRIGEGHLLVTETRASAAFSVSLDWDLRLISLWLRVTAASMA